MIDDLRTTDDMGILMITHDLSTVARYVDRIAVMYLGRIVEQGRTRDVLANPKEIPSGCRFRLRCPHAIEACATTDPSLRTAGAARVPEHQAACIRT